MILSDFGRVDLVGNDNNRRHRSMRRCNRNERGHEQFASSAPNASFWEIYWMALSIVVDDLECRPIDVGHTAARIIDNESEAKCESRIH